MNTPSGERARQRARPRLEDEMSDSERSREEVMYYRVTHRHQNHGNSALDCDALRGGPCSCGEGERIAKALEDALVRAGESR